MEALPWTDPHRDDGFSLVVDDKDLAITLQCLDAYLEVVAEL
jgi:hypothetical protein